MSKANQIGGAPAQTFAGQSEITESSPAARSISPNHFTQDTPEGYGNNNLGSNTTTSPSQT